MRSVTVLCTTDAEYLSTEAYKVLRCFAKVAPKVIVLGALQAN